MKKTIRNYERIVCLDCGGDGFSKDFKECVKCHGSGSLTKKIILSENQKVIIEKFKDQK